MGQWKGDVYIGLTKVGEEIEFAPTEEEFKRNMARRWKTTKGLEVEIKNVTLEDIYER